MNVLTYHCVLALENGSPGSFRRILGNMWDLCLMVIDEQTPNSLGKKSVSEGSNWCSLSVTSGNVNV